MKLSNRVLGSTITSKLAENAAAALLVIGKDTFHRSDLAHIDCFNFMAAIRLSSAIATLRVKDTKDLFQTVPPSALVLPSIGAISLAVLGAAFEVKGLGGDQPLEAWMQRHRSDATRPLVTFHSLKAQEHAREVGERKARKEAKARKARRRDQAQRLRGDRYIERQEKAAAE